MTYSYFPGCTLKTKAKDLDHYARISAEALGFTLEELPDWQCCGGVYPMAKNEIATKLSSIRALAKAKELGQPLVTLCSACHNVIKQVNHDMQTDDNIVLKANNYLKLEEPYQGETEVLHYLEVLRDKVGFDELKKKVVNPLKGKKIAAYYGCLLLRPGKTMQMDNPENPKILEDFIRAIGATPVLYPMRNECCGGYLTLDEKSVAESRSNKVMTSAKDHGDHRMSALSVQPPEEFRRFGSAGRILYRAAGGSTRSEIRRNENGRFERTRSDDQRRESAEVYALRKVQRYLSVL